MQKTWQTHFTRFKIILLQVLRNFCPSSETAYRHLKWYSHDEAGRVCNLSNGLRRKVGKSKLQKAFSLLCQLPQYNKRHVTVCLSTQRLQSGNPYSNYYLSFFWHHIFFLDQWNRSTSSGWELIPHQGFIITFNNPFLKSSTPPPLAQFTAPECVPAL